jgi:cytochrome P450
MHQLPQGQLGKWAHELAKEYGEMFTIKIGGTRMVFLTSTRTIKDLLERRAAVYRNEKTAINNRYTVQDSGCRCWEIPCREGSGTSIYLILKLTEYRILLMPYNDLWRNARKIMHQLLTTKQAESYRPFQDLESRQLCWDYLHNPGDFYLHNARYANSGTAPFMHVLIGSDHVGGVWQTHSRRR